MEEKQYMFLMGAKEGRFYGELETSFYKLTEYHQNGRKIKISGEKYLNLDGHGMLG